MSKRSIPYLALLVVIAFTACKKDEVKVADLSTNPFDADYDGAPIFSFLSSATATQVINGVPTEILTIQVRVHTAYFGRPTTYLIAAGAPVNTVVLSNEVEDGVFSLNIMNTTSGQQYCVPLRVGNGGSYGGGNTICATAE